MPWDEGLVNSLVYDRPDPGEGRVLSYAQAINEALALALENDPSVFVLGQGVDDPLAMFGTTRGLPARFGPSRVFDTPLSEEAMMGVSAGAAMNGMRPVFMHNRPDFVLLAFNQLVTHAAKFHFMETGRRPCRWWCGQPSAAGGDPARSTLKPFRACCLASRD